MIQYCHNFNYNGRNDEIISKMVKGVVSMCLILFAYHVHPEIPLIVAANRDEFYQRPTKAAHFWKDRPDILAGRDLEKMGTWMGISKNGRFAALTNYRNPHEETEGKRSRGELVVQYLTYNGNSEDYIKRLEKEKGDFPGYNILIGDVNKLYYYSNVNSQMKVIEPGIYGLSNHFLNTDWPKVKIGKKGLLKVLTKENEQIKEELFQLLDNSTPAPDELLPYTGVSLEWERMLSPLFIKSDHYGTRSSAVLFMREKKTDFYERVFQNNKITEQHFVIEQ